MIKVFSPNMLKTFEECEKKFFFKYIEKKSLPQRSKIFEKGKKIHALASYFLNGFDIKKMTNTLDEDEYNAWVSLKENKYFNLPPVETEYSLTAKIEGFWIGGRLDALVYNSDNDYFILDYKTGSIPKNAENDFQTITYLLCADKLLKKKNGYSSLKFVYIGLKKNDSKEILLSDERKQGFEKKISDTCKNIENAILTNHWKSCTNCDHCEYCKICKQN